MANLISSGEVGDDCIQLSNGLTSVFIDVLTLSGSKLAQNDDEKRLIVWLAEKDQSAVGIGTVGFDISEMPWNIKRFDECKRFMMKTIEAAENRTGWDKLDYQPSEELLFPNLKKFAEMIGKLTVNDVYPNALEDWRNSAENDDPILNGFPKCPKHEVLMTYLGCLFCAVDETRKKYD